MKRSIHTLSLLTALAVASTAHAQTTPAPTDSTTAPMPPVLTTPAPVSPAPSAAPLTTATTSSPTPLRPHLVAQRAETSVRAELDQQRALLAQADNDLLEVKKTTINDKAVVDIKKGEIDVLSTKIKAAKQAKDDAARKPLETERKKQQLMQTFFERVVDADDALSADVSARRDHAKASVAALELELQFLLRLAGPDAANDPQLLPLEQQILAAQRSRGEALEIFARKDQELADRRGRVYRAWTDYLGGIR